MYITYEQYQSMGGNMNETAFNNAEFEARSVVNWYTFNRFKQQTTYPEELVFCMFQLIGLIDLQSKLLNGPTDSEGHMVSGAIASQSNDGVSISYNVLSATELLNTCKLQVKQVIERYLTDVTNELGRKVLYRGVYPNE